MKNHLYLLLGIGTLALVLSGCAGNNAQIMQESDFYGLAEPSEVLVGQFAYSANDPSPNQSILNRMHNQVTQTSPQIPEEQTGLSVAQKMQKSLIKDLNREGIVASGTLDNVIPPVGSMVIEGELLTAKDAKSFQRLSVGLGSGQAKVVSYVSVYLVTPKGLVNFAQFYSNTQTSVQTQVATKLIVGSGAGGAAAPAGGSVDALTARGQSAQADAVMISKQIARKMRQIFAAESWITPNFIN